MPGDWIKEYDRLHEKALAGKPTEADAHRMGSLLYDHAREIIDIFRERDRLREALEEILPRYMELFAHAGLGNPDDSIAVQIARKALGGGNLGAEKTP